MPIVENLQNISRDGMVASCYQNCVYTYLTATVQIFQKSLDCIYFQSENFQLESRIVFFSRVLCILLRRVVSFYKINKNITDQMTTVI